MLNIDKFNDVFQVPPAMRRYIERVIDPKEMELILAMRGETLDIPEIARRLKMPLKAAHDFVLRSYERHITTKVVGDKKVGYVFDYVDEAGREIRFAPAKFFDRLEPVTTMENWAGIPDEIRKQISQWWLAEYVKKVEPIVEKIKKDPAAYYQIKQKDFLLLEEALEQAAAAELHVVLNCDCRASEQACHHIRQGCIRFDDGARYTIGRGLGRILTKEQCSQLIIETDRDGLMHIGALGWKEHGLFGICNCCTCCCFPLRTSQRLNSQKVYPRSHYVASRNLEDCLHCGRCTRRCQFDAFYQRNGKIEIKGKARRKVSFDSNKCYGCGLCATACPKGAIEMVRISSAR